MTGSLIAILVILALIFFWLDGARARELAVSITDELCRRRGYQLLDETVAMTRLGLARTAHGIRFKRMFQFDYSIEGVGRQRGHVLLHGSQAVWLDLAEPKEPDAADSTITVESAQKKRG